MKTLKGKILKILKGYYVNSLRPVSMKITSLVEKDYVEKEFVEWKDKNVAKTTTSSYWLSDERFDTLDEVYQYWLKNVKDK